MLITFLVRSKQFPMVAYHRFYATIESASDLAYIINEDSKTIEFKCLLDEVILDSMTASRYKPSKLVSSFDYSKQ